MEDIKNCNNQMIWEAIGPDGVQYPDSKIYKNMKAQFEYLDARAEIIKSLLIQIDEGDNQACALLGEIISTDAIKYLKN